MYLVEAEVRKIKPDGKEDAAKWEAGYVQVRIYGQENSEEKIKDEHLAWAIPVQDITSAATEKIGTSPTGMLVGTRVLLAYSENDTQKRNPYIIGTVARAGSSKSGDYTEGFRDVNDSDGDVPIGSLGSTPIPATNVQSNRNGNNRRLNSREAFDNNKRRYNNIPYRNKNEGSDGLANSKKNKAARYGDMPTVGSVYSENMAPVLDMIRKVDPTGKSAMLPNAALNIKKIIDLDKLTSTAGISGLLGGSLGNVLSTISGAKNFANVIKSFASAFNIKGASSIQTIGNKTKDDITTDPNLINLINVINDMMQQLGGFKQANEVISAIPAEYKTALYEGLLKLIQSVEYDFSVKVISKTINTTVISASRLPYPVITSVPDGYVEVYSYQDEDPYPGWILWENPDGGYYFCLRPADKPYCSSPEEDGINYGIFFMLKEMTTLINNKKLTYAALIDLLMRIFALIEDRSHQNAFGKNVKKNNIMNFLQQLLGALGSAINQAKSQHLPKSVLNQDKVNEALKKYSKEASVVKKKKPKGKLAVSGTNPRPPKKPATGVMTV